LDLQPLPARDKPPFSTASLPHPMLYLNSSLALLAPEPIYVLAIKF
jgi:hypothetical protein